MYFILALIAGAFISIQASMNAKIGTSLNSSLLATTIAFTISAIICGSVFLLSSNKVPAIESFHSIPSYYWLSGAFSAIGVGLFYFLIPQMGVGKMMSFALTAQLVMAMLIAHFGFFDSQTFLITPIKALGVISMISGIILINR